MPVHNHFFRSDDNQEINARALTVAGPFFTIEIQVPPDISDALKAAGEPVPEPETGIAIIDTGASLTCVHQEALERLKLNPFDIVKTGTANGIVDQQVYPASIVFPTRRWRINLQGVAGVDLTGQNILDPPQPVIALIGRNVLENWVFAYNGPGGFWTVSF